MVFVVSVLTGAVVSVLVQRVVRVSKGQCEESIRGGREGSGEVGSPRRRSNSGSGELSPVRQPEGRPEPSLVKICFVCIIC